MRIISFIFPLLLVAAASSSRLTQEEVEIRVDARKREVLQQAGCKNEYDIYSRLFCLCPSCHQRPLLHRIVAIAPATVYRHKKNRPLPEVRAIFGNRHSVTVEKYFALYRKYVQGDATEFGVLLVHPQGAAETV